VIQDFELISRELHVLGQYVFAGRALITQSLAAVRIL
jgi:hypothetical protein